MMEDCDNNADDDGDTLVDCADPECATSPLCGDLVINEVDYDNPGADTAEFVEIFNRGTTTVDLSTVELAPINGNNDTEYNIVQFSGTLAPGGYLVVANPGTPNIAPGATVVAWTNMNSIQNGAPDGVVLRAGSVILDSMSYEGAMMGVTEGNPTLAADDDSMTQSSLIRFPNGADTNDNATDWAKTLTLTPGAANVLLGPAEVCNDGIDNNMNMLTDCAEQSCNAQPCGMNGLTCAMSMCSCPGGMTEMACADGMDNDCDGLSDCADPQCAATPNCSEICNDGIDNNMNMQIDCAEMTCAGQSCGLNGVTCSMGMCSCPGGATETLCNDGLDNDCDGMPDCMDPNCAMAMNCQMPNLPTVTSVDYPVIAHGGRLVITGSNLGGATSVTIGGVATPFVVNSPTQITLASVGDSTPIGAQSLLVTSGVQSSAPFQVTAIRLLINEIDSDTPGADMAEFVELSTGVPNVNLNGYSLVLWNGNGDTSYFSASLNVTTDANGLVVIGNSALSPAIVFNDNVLQNGQDAVAVHQGAALMNGTMLTSAGLIDALVYDTADADDPGLLMTLLGTGMGAIQVDEAATMQSEQASIQRCNIGRLNGTQFSVVSPPSPGAPNGAMCP
jgi:hypothetical protein